jgi:hypothetical protein
MRTGMNIYYTTHFIFELIIKNEVLFKRQDDFKKEYMFSL